MYVYVVSYDSEYMAEHPVKSQALHVFTKLEDAREFYLTKFVKPFLRKHQVSEYFSFDPLTATTKAEWDDILQTFNETAHIEKVLMD